MLVIYWLTCRLIKTGIRAACKIHCDSLVAWECWVLVICDPRSSFLKLVVHTNELAQVRHSNFNITLITNVFERYLMLYWLNLLLKFFLFLVLYYFKFHITRWHIFTSFYWPYNVESMLILLLMHLPNLRSAEFCHTNLIIGLVLTDRRRLMKPYWIKASLFLIIGTLRSLK